VGVTKPNNGCEAMTALRQDTISSLSRFGADLSGGRRAALDQMAQPKSKSIENALPDRFPGSRETKT
jgi:hypothetical protein